MSDFKPDYQIFLEVLRNHKPVRLPLYEHIISPVFMEKVWDRQFAELKQGDDADLREFMTQYCRFFQEMTYDMVSFEVCVTEALSDSGAIMGGRPGPIQNRNDFDRYPWPELSQKYWSKAEKQYRILGDILPEGMKAVGGIGNGVFEVCEDLVGYEYLCYMLADDPELFADIFQKVGDLLIDLWCHFLNHFSTHYVACRFGDDLGFKSSTLLPPKTIKEYILPQYQRIIDLVHSNGKPFLWHSCGCIFKIMDEVIEVGIDAKHSNEDTIAPFEKWIDLYGDRIGLLGGIDVDLLCKEKPGVITERVFKQGKKYRVLANGYALGSGNSIPEYVPPEGYLAMIEGVKKIRHDEI